MTTHAIYIDARRPEAQFSLRVMGYSASSIEISVLNGAALADLTGQGIALWYGPVPATGQPQLGHTVTGTVTASGCAVVDLALADTGYEGRLVAQVVSIVDGVSSVLGSGEIWMLANPARDTLPMTFDGPPWATAEDIDAAISARVADVEDLPASPTYDQVIAHQRAVLSALKGAATIALAMLALGAGAQTSRLGSLRAGDVVVTNEQDALAYPVATNALALAEGALQADATNGMLTVESDPIAGAAISAHAGRTDNPHGVTAAQIGALTSETDSVALPVALGVSNALASTTLRSLATTDDRVDSLRILACPASTNLADGNFTFGGDGFFPEDTELAYRSDLVGWDVWSSETLGTQRLYLWQGKDGDDTVSDAVGVEIPEGLAIDTWRLWRTSSGGYFYLEECGTGPLPVHESYGFVWVAPLPYYEPVATSNWVESIRGVHADIATNVVYHVVVSNGHWLIQEVE